MRQAEGRFALLNLFPAVRQRLRRGDGGDDGAGQADFRLADEEHGLVLARLRFARHQQRAVGRFFQLATRRR